MVKRYGKSPFLVLPLETEGGKPLYRQLYEGVRQAILSGQLRPGVRLPATRQLAEELNLSRTTILIAFEQLLAEGYVEGRVGDGTYVARTLPEELLANSPAHDARGKPQVGQRRLSQRGERIASLPLGVTPGAIPQQLFRLGIPALDLFPFDIWERLARQQYRQAKWETLDYGDPAGYAPLRETLAAYLRTARAVRCTAEQVLIVSGSQQAIDLVARVLLDPGEAAWIEDPGYPGPRGALMSQGVQMIPVPVDSEGLDIAQGRQRAPQARMAYVTPSHQYPLGVVMSLKRRLQLLEWANETGMWVLEDDYDGEFRYQGRPLASLQGLDEKGQVIYIGTFSKVLFPALRLGYLVVPPELVAAFRTARALADRHSPGLEQAIVADFIAQGHFVRHIRRMRTLYAQRQQMLLEAIGRELAGELEVVPHEAGMHLVGWLGTGCSDQEVAQRALKGGLHVPALSAYTLQTRQRPGVLLGYTAMNEAEIQEGVHALKRLLRKKEKHQR